MTDSELLLLYPDVASIQLALVTVAYKSWLPVEKYCRMAKKPNPRTLPEVVSDILPMFRQGATAYLENPRYRGRKALGELIMEAIKDADPAALVKKFLTKVEKALKA